MVVARGVKALVTGSNGLIGSNIVRVLLNQGHQVRGLVRAISDLRGLGGLDWSGCRATCSIVESLEAAMRGLRRRVPRRRASSPTGDTTSDSSRRSSSKGRATRSRRRASRRGPRVVLTSSSVTCGSSPRAGAA